MEKFNLILVMQIPERIPVSLPLISEKNNFLIVKPRHYHHFDCFQGSEGNLSVGDVFKQS